MNPHDPNVRMLESVAAQLGEDLRRQLVFVGGAVTGLLITDSTQPAIRPTEDVDLIVRTVVRNDYRRIEAQLRARDFANDLSADAPICRWRNGSMKIDVMPTLKKVLGFANRWYPLAMDTAEQVQLPSGVCIRMITASLFIATKLEAFNARGNNDYLFSHDLGDLIAVIDGRESLLEECEQTDPQLRAYLHERLTGLLAIPSFREALPGHLPSDAISQARLPELEEKLARLASQV